MMKYIYVSAFLAIFSTKEPLAQKLPEERTWLLKADMLTLINDFTFPLAQVSLEKRFSKFSIAPEIGIQPFGRIPTDQDTSLVKWNGFRVGVEGRYYGLFKNERNYEKPNRPWAEKYVSLNIFYRQNQYNSRVTYYKPNDTTAYNDCFAANKKAWGVNIIFGIQTYKGRFVADFYGGFGILDRITKNRFREYDYALDEIENNFTLVSFKQQASLAENSGTIGNIILGIRLGMRL